MIAATEGRSVLGSAAVAAAGALELGTVFVISGSRVLPIKALER